MKRRTALGLIALTPAAAAGLFACRPADDDTDLSTSLVVGATAEVAMLDPVINTAAAIPQALLYNCYETLVKLDATNTVQPLLATRWDISDDRLTYTFHLDQRATFTTGGRPVTADDVVWSIERGRAEGHPSLRGELAPIDTVTATDDRTVTIVLKQPSNLWLLSMTGASGIVYDSQAGVDFAAAVAGSGPYEVTNWSPGSDLVLTRRASPWAEAPFFSDVTFRYFSTPNPQNAAMLAGQLDILSSLQAPQALPQFEDPAQFAIIEGTSQGEVVMGFNNAGILADKKLRQAIRHAVNHQALLDTVWGGHGELIGSMVPSTDPWYEDLTGLYPFDQAKARALISEADYDGTPLRMRLPVLPYATAAGQFVASQLRDVGLEVAVDELEFPGRWLDVVMGQFDYDISIISHVEPRDLVKFANPDYYWRYDNEEVQRLVAQADAGTEEEMVTKLKQAARIVAEDAACDFLFVLPNLVVTTPDIRGVAQDVTSLSFDLTTLSREA